jgi:hypothetical protein
MTTIYFIKYTDIRGYGNIPGDVVEFFYSQQDAFQRKIEIFKLMEEDGDVNWYGPQVVHEMKILVGRVKQKTIHHLIDELNKINKIL